MLARDYKIRVFTIFVFFVVLFGIVVVRLFLIQIKQKAFFQDLARQQHELEVTLSPARAIIYDRSGTVPLAFNRHVQSAFILPRQITEWDKLEPFLKRNYPEICKRITHNPDRGFTWLERHLTPERYQFLAERELHDIQFIGEYERYYPFITASQVVGMTDIDNAGIAGIELANSTRLGGKPTTVRIEKDARSGSFFFKKLVEKRGHRGSSVVLTLDRQLQAMACHELKKSVQGLHAKSGSVLIINPENGEVLAMANFPTFDPNQKGDKDVDFSNNRIVCECYELGSVMKAICALAALEEGVVSYDEIIDCEGRYAYVDGVRIENPTIVLLRLLEEKHGLLPFYDVLHYSSNVGIAKVAKRLGPRYYTHLQRLGFGKKTHIQFPGERAGFINPPSRWSRPSLFVMSFGYEMMVSLIQLAKAFCVIANGGYAVQPTLIKGEEKQSSHNEKLYKDHTISVMKSILAKIGSKYPISGFNVFGKTGTARKIVNGRFSTTAHRFTFAGIVEKPDYRRVVIAFIDEPEKAGLWASEVAAPLFSAVAERMVVHDMARG
jgi:cell division protein FtsI (penicillin-binding protein 3)